MKVKNVDGQPHLCLDASISAPGSSANEMLRAWMEQADKLENGEISKEEYDEWRYKYPELDTYQKRAKVPSQECIISDAIESYCHFIVTNSN